MCALVVTSVALAAGAGEAVASNVPLHLTLTNNLPDGFPARVTLVDAGGSDCWEDGDLKHPLDQKYVEPHQSLTYNTDRVVGSFSCSQATGTRGIALEVQEPGGNWYVPAGENPGTGYAIVEHEIGSTPTPGFHLVGSLRTWSPRPDGRGLICWETLDHFRPHGPREGLVDINVFGDLRCNQARDSEIVPDLLGPTGRVALDRRSVAPGPLNARAAPIPSSGTRPDERRPRTLSANNGVIIDLLSSVDIACRWYAFGDNPGVCNGLNAGDQSRWSIDNVSSDVRDFKVTGTASGVEAKYSVGSAQVSIPSTGSPGKLAVQKEQTTSQTTTQASQRGGKVGGKISFKVKNSFRLPFTQLTAETTVEVNGEANWSTTDSTATSNSQTIKVDVEAGAKPGYTTRLDVFTTKRDANYTYTADLGFGKDNTVQNVTTPANQALDQSQAARQPCLAYVVGDNQVRNSLTNIGQQLLNAGYTPDNSELPAERRGFLASIPYFFTSGAPCPGFPPHYASMAGFKGSGVGTYADLGYDKDGKPVQVMTGCVSQTPFPAQLSRARRLSPRRWWIPGASRAVGAGAEPCQDVPVKGGNLSSVTPATLMDDRHTPAEGHGLGARAPLLEGQPGSADVIMGSNAGGTIDTEAGPMDIVYAGRGPTRIYGDSAENVLYGGPGRDVLIGRHGVSYLHAAGAGDRLIASNAFAVMYGGTGRTTFEGHNMRGVMFGGSGANRMLATGNLSRLAMTSPRGASTVYELRGSGNPTIVQLPGGRGTVMTDHSFRLPVNINTAIATGRRAITLQGNQGTHRLVANQGADRLIAGPDPAVLVGGKGRDTIVFNAMNDDRATGGRGADRYVFTGVPQNFPRPAGLARPARRFAPAITNFNPAKGDRLVLRSSVFGSQLLNLRRVFRVVANRDPRPRCRCATLLLNTRTGLLSFDRDGTGPIADKVIVQLPRFRTIKRNWLQIER